MKAVACSQKRWGPGITKGAPALELVMECEDSYLVLEPTEE